jgi:hypothetical protein
MRSRGWIAFLVDLPDEPAVVIFSPFCAASEFDYVRRPGRLRG